MSAAGRLRDDRVAVWWLRPGTLADPLVRDAVHAIVTPDERARSARFVFDRDRDAFLAARAQLRVALAQVTGRSPRSFVFVIGPQGKPDLDRLVDGRRLAFNVSHVHALVTCAVAWERAIGVDVESFERDPPLEVAERFFAAPEAAELRALPDAEQRAAFYEYWTLKESFIKAVGTGLSMPLHDFAVRRSPPGLIAFGAMTSPADWSFHRLTPAQDCTAALCVATAPREPVIDTGWLAADDIVAAASTCTEDDPQPGECP
jgi:4'-phosphopantetheinyl transferase